MCMRANFDPDIFENHSADIEDFLEDRFRNRIVYIGGACLTNERGGNQAGYGVWFNDGHSCNLKMPVKGEPTMNTAVLQAAAKAVEMAHEESFFNPVKIITDSQFLLRSISEINVGLSHDWYDVDGPTLANRDEWCELDVRRLLFDDDIIFQYANPNSGNHGNDMANKLAKQGALVYKK